MIIVAGLVIAFVLVLIFSNPGTRHCRWREDRRRQISGKTAFICVSCGAEGFTTNGKPPLDCQARNQRD